MSSSIDPVVIHRRAFRRSRISIEIVLTLQEHGPLTLPDLARLVGADPRNVLGALVGDETDKRKRYRTSQALVVLGIVDGRDELDETIYDLTSTGHTIAAKLEADVDRRRGPRPRMRT